MDSLEQKACDLSELFEMSDEDFKVFLILTQTSLVDPSKSTRVAARNYLQSIVEDSFNLERIYELEGDFYIDAKVMGWGTFNARVCRVPEIYTGLYDEQVFVEFIYESDSSGNEYPKPVRLLS